MTSRILLSILALSTAVAAEVPPKEDAVKNESQPNSNPIQLVQPQPTQQTQGQAKDKLPPMDSAKTEQGKIEPVKSEKLPPMDPAKTELTKGSTFNEAQVKEIQQIVLNTLSNNPEKVVEALQAFGEKHQREEMKKMEASIAENKDKLLGDAGSISLGNKGGTVKLVLFVDPNCPHCREFEKILHQVKKNYGKLEIIYRLLPILGPKSEEAVKVLLAASLADRDKLAGLLEKVASSKEPLDKAKVIQLAKELGYDGQKLEDKMKDEAVAKAIKANEDLAQQIGLQGTPTSMLTVENTLKLINPTDQKSLEEYLKPAL
jgi:protein-disulfide isomerase